MFRTASWLIYGARWFTASGYERSAQGFDARDDHVRSVPDGLRYFLQGDTAAGRLQPPLIRHHRRQLRYRARSRYGACPARCYRPHVRTRCPCAPVACDGACRVCRSPQRGEEALLAICQSTGSKRVHLHTCDISELSDIRRFAREFASGGHRADTLINNAGGMAASVIRTREGAEQSFAANVLGKSRCDRCIVPGISYLTRDKALTT